jgi:hypothetical protein
MKKQLTLALCISTALLTACSDNSSSEQQAQSGGLQKELKTVSSDNHEGVWGFCNDKQASVTADEESCQTIDASVWHLADGELTALDVTNTATEGCTTACFNINDEMLETTVAAKGYYEYDENGYTFTITESTDETRFPVCTVNWTVSNQMSDDIAQWTFNNVDCDLPEINYSAWAKKYKGKVN